MTGKVNYYTNPTRSIPWKWGTLGDDTEDGWVVLKGLLPSDVGSNIISAGGATEYSEVLVHEVINKSDSVNRLKDGHHCLLLLNGGMKGVKDSSIVCAKASDIVLNWNPEAWARLHGAVNRNDEPSIEEGRKLLAE
jgi:hypothetical protein